MKNESLKHIIKKPISIVKSLGARGLLNWIPDKIYLKLIYRGTFEKKLDFNKPETFNEKLQWLKIYDRNPLYCTLVDKYAVRSYISEKIGDQYLFPLLGVYNSPQEINWNELPNKFVLKCTHGSGTNIICKNKDELDIKIAKKKLNTWLKRNWYWFGREWPYKNIKPKIICEKYMVDDKGDQLKDYRFFCFNGEPKFVALDFNIIDKSKTRRNLYDLDWNLMDEGITYPRELNIQVKKPQNLDKMIELSKILSKNIPHVRIDFYSIGERIYFGEMTFYHQGGFGKIYPDEFAYKMGEWLKVNQIN